MPKVQLTNLLARVVQRLPHRRYEEPEDLVAYSRSTNAEHLPARRKFNRLAANTDAVRIWQETYRITADQWETIYGGTDDVGLFGPVGGRTLTGASTSTTRMSDTHHDQAPDRNR